CVGCRSGEAFNQAFSMAFQPIIDITTGKTFAQEALVRGLSGEGAQSVRSQITEQNRYGFDQACRTLAIEQATGLGILDTEALLSINFMPNAVYEPEVCIRQTMLAAERAGLPPERLIFEFTEQEKIDVPHLQRIVSAYREFGFRTAIDDFGAGYSGLALLTQLKTDIVKIDIELVRNINTEPVKRVVLRHIVNMLNDLDKDIIFEGIETHAELEVIRDMGGRLVQGYLIAKPAFEALVQPELTKYA
ncbi:MAG: EAL domain-containing protein, partial [Alphaproteobacteria bacterium]|nr:EAL domain-containing protein [Alphaproteobacteria bacterium]